jgi:ethanolamine transporter EutH
MKPWQTASYRILFVVGYLYCFLVGAFILVCLLGIWWSRGFWELCKVLSPFNIVNWILTVLSLLPGFLVVGVAEKLRKNWGQ